MTFKIGSTIYVNSLSGGVKQVYQSKNRLTDAFSSYLYTEIDYDDNLSSKAFQSIPVILDNTNHEKIVKSEEYWIDCTIKRIIDSEENKLVIATPNNTEFLLKGDEVFLGELNFNYDEEKGLVHKGYVNYKNGTPMGLTDIHRMHEITKGLSRYLLMKTDISPELQFIDRGWFCHDIIPEEFPINEIYLLEGDHITTLRKEKTYPQQIKKVLDTLMQHTNEPVVILSNLDDKISREYFKLGNIEGIRIGWQFMYRR